MSQVWPLRCPKRSTVFSGHGGGFVHVSIQGEAFLAPGQAFGITHEASISGLG